MDADVYDLDRLRGTLRPQIEWHPTIGSTNDRARQLAAQLPPQQTALVLAEQQTAGRGRGGNRWWTGAGSIALSYLTARHQGPQSLGPIVSLAAGLAVVDALKPHVAQPSLGIHWPNDVFVAQRKVAGILVEALADGRRIVGIGINVNNSLAEAPWEVSRVATALVDLAGQRLDRTALVIDLVEQLDASIQLAWQHPQRIAALADQACLQRGLVLTVTTPAREVTGRCTGIAPDGALLLETANGCQSIHSGVLVHER